MQNIDIQENAGFQLLLESIKEAYKIEKKYQNDNFIAVQYQYKKHELFDNFVLYIVKDMPMIENKDLSPLKKYRYIQLYKKQFNSYPNWDTDEYLKELYMKISKESELNAPDDSLKSYLPPLSKFIKSSKLLKLH